MATIHEIGQQLDSICNENGMLPKAQGALAAAAEQFETTKATLASATVGTQHRLPPETIRLMDTAIESVADTRAVLTSALGGIATFRGKVLGIETSASTLPDQPEQLFATRPVSKPHVTPASTTQTIFRTSSGTRLGKTSEAEIQAVIDEQIEKSRRTRADFVDFIHTCPNHNERFEAEITATQTCLAALGLPPSRVIVLGREQFDRSMALNRRRDDVAGYHFPDGSLSVVLDDPNTSERQIFGDQQVLGTMLHEGGHVAKGRLHELVLDRVTAENHHTIKAKTVSEDFFKLNTNTGAREGVFLEEGFADYVRTEAQAALGKEMQLPFSTPAPNNRLFTSADQHPKLPSTQPGSTLEIPGRHLTAIKYLPGNRPIMTEIPATMSGYAIRLLCNEVPELRQTLIAARSDPGKQTEVAKLINGVQPSLYSKLRRLPNDKASFDYGLRLVGQAIRDKNGTAPRR